MSQDDANGDEPPPEVEYYFHHTATLRIFGVIEDFDSISRTLGVVPSHTHRRGESRSRRSPHEHDMWSYSADVPEERPLTEHLDALWLIVEPHLGYLKGLKKDVTVDVFCGYRSNCGTAGFEVDHHALRMFIELEVPFSVSVIG